MSITIETDLKDILTRLDQKLDRMQIDMNDLKIGQARLEGKIEALDERLTGKIESLDERLSGEVKTLEEKLTGEIKTLDAKVDGLSTRVGDREFISRAVLGGLILIVLGDALKIFSVLIPTTK